MEREYFAWAYVKVLAGVVLVFSLLAGCGGDDEPTMGDPAPVTSQQKLRNDLCFPQADGSFQCALQCSTGADCPPAVPCISFQSATVCNSFHPPAH